MAIRPLNMVPVDVSGFAKIVLMDVEPVMSYQDRDDDGNPVGDPPSQVADGEGVPLWKFIFSVKVISAGRRQTSQMEVKIPHPDSEEELVARFEFQNVEFDNLVVGMWLGDRAREGGLFFRADDIGVVEADTERELAALMVDQ